MLRLRARCCASASAVSRARLSVCRSSRVASSRSTSRRALRRAGEAVEDLDEVALPQAGVGVVRLGVAHLDHEAEAEDGQQQPDDQLRAVRVREG